MTEAERKLVAYLTREAGRPLSPQEIALSLEQARAFEGLPLRRKPTVDEMRRHALWFCVDRITVERCKRPSQARALSEVEEIRIAPIKGAISYATAMHEIGHVLGATSAAAASWCASGGPGSGREVMR